MKVMRFGCALVAGLAMSAVAGAEPGARQAGGVSVRVQRAQPQVTQSTTAVRAPIAKLYPVNQKHANALRGPVDPIIYDAITGCAQITRVIDNTTDLRSPAAYFDDGAFFPATGGATVSEMDVTLWALTATDPITFRVTFWDTIDFVGDPIVQSTQLFTAEYQLTGTVVNTTPGAYIIGIDTTGLVLPDDDWGVEVAVISGIGGTIMPEANTGVVPVLPAAPCSNTHPVVGANQAIFWLDGDFYPAVPMGDGIRYEPFVAETGEGDAFAFAAGGPMNGIAMTMYGQPNIPPTPSGGCCVASGCVVRTEADCMTEGGVYQGDDTDCTGTFNPPNTASNFIPFGDVIGNAVDTISVGSSGTITDLDIGLNIEHSWQGDVTVTLQSPAGTMVDLIVNPGDPAGTGSFGANDFGDLDLPLPMILDDAAEQAYQGPDVQRANVRGRWQPDNALAAFNGEEMSGIWTLTVSDAAAQDDGILASWSLSFNSPSDLCPTSGFCDADWCEDGSVGVPDIFCFLSDWFALDPEARNYGGTPGVPAIFAFLSEWFGTGQGPCTP